MYRLQCNSEVWQQQGTETEVSQGLDKITFDCGLQACIINEEAQWMTCEAYPKSKTFPGWHGYGGTFLWGGTSTWEVDAEWLGIQKQSQLQEEFKASQG